MQALGIDIGGSGIKGALVDTLKGRFIGDRIRIPTPSSFKREAVSEAIASLVREFDFRGPVGAGFPAAVANGIVLTPPTAHHVPGWQDRDVNALFADAAGVPVAVLNDADAAGLAEMRFGAGRGERGLVITVTLGTGVGAGMFMDGRIVPNLEVGKLFLAEHAEAVEHYMAGRVKKEHNLAWSEYGERLAEFCRHVEHLFSPSLIIIGGGISRKHEKFLSSGSLKRARIVPAKLRNQAGIVGAAVWAAESAE
jgi:polyphosphate glucokinase